jgi:hypothetical protein
VTDVEVNQNLVIEEMQAFGVTPGANLHEITAADSVPLEEEVICYIYLC